MNFFLFIYRSAYGNALTDNFDSKDLNTKDKNMFKTFIFLATITVS